ncbi:MAG: lytic transglycosylase domain-containing protein [Paramuribaculum sp.]|nr:lytic transglycosylase domain-containing protein [Paramuribaculum sp.]
MKIRIHYALYMLAASLIPTVASASEPMSEVVNPTIPKKVKYAGVDVDLDRTDMWERLDRELTAMSYTHGNTLLTLKRANRYFPQLVPILEECGVPTDLVYLACIESSLNPIAVSPAKAAGLWQFMPSTAKEYGLEVNDNVDERYHPEKATRAACRYLKSAYAKYGNWESAAASYNGGMGRISSELNSQLAQSAYDLYLTPETSRYMFRILAMKMIMENPRRYGYHLTSDQFYQPIACDTVHVDTTIVSWPQWAADHGISYLTLREVNPWIRSKQLPNASRKTYIVNVPVKESLYRSSQPKQIYRKEWIND